MFDVENRDLLSKFQNTNSLNKADSNGRYVNRSYATGSNNNDRDSVILNNAQNGKTSEKPAREEKKQYGFLDMTWDIFKNITGIGKKSVNTAAPAKNMTECETQTATQVPVIHSENPNNALDIKYEEISKLSISEKRNMIADLEIENTGAFDSSINKLVKSMGIDTRPLAKDVKAGFYDALSSIERKDSSFRTFDFENPNFKIDLRYPREKFIQDIDKITSDLSEQDRNTVCGYFGFEMKNVFNNKVINGYPSDLNNGGELAEIQNPELKKTIEKMRPLVKEFSENNEVKIQGEVELSKEMNKIIKAFPEFLTEIGKKQHGTHNFTLDIHSLKVLQGVINNPDFEKLPQNDKTALKIVALFHDITKRENLNDKLHPKESAFDIKYLLQKLELDENEKQKIYKIAKNHNWLEMYNKKGAAIIPNIAYELKNGNDFKMACILTEADLKAVQRNEQFYSWYKADFERGKQEVGQFVDKIK